MRRPVPTFYGVPQSKAPLAQAVAQMPFSAGIAQLPAAQAAAVAQAAQAVQSGKKPSSLNLPAGGLFSQNAAANTLMQQMASPISAIAQAAAGTAAAAAKPPKKTGSNSSGAFWSLADQKAPSFQRGSGSGNIGTGRTVTVKAPASNAFATTPSGTTAVAEVPIDYALQAAGGGAVPSAAEASSGGGGGGGGGGFTATEDPAAEEGAPVEDAGMAAKAMAWLKEPMFGVPRGVLLAGAAAGGFYFYRGRR